MTLTCGRGLFYRISLIQFTTGFKCFEHGIKIFPSVGALMNFLRPLYVYSNASRFLHYESSLSLLIARMPDLGVV